MAGSIHADGKRVAIDPAPVRGRFATARRGTFFVLLAIYVALPWIQVGGHPAVLLDLAAGHFHVLGGTFNAQDAWLLTFVLLGLGATLLFVTALAGRVWCGWACPQTVFLEGVFRPLERLLGARRHGALWRKALVHAIYVALGLGIARLFLAYFSTAPSPWLVGVMGAALYANFGWFREQTCVVVCPYGRLQGVLIDADSLVVGYDRRRGEPRGKVKDESRGACVDCRRCVAVCPTGIDIRDGLQLDCVGCTACIDACDEIMDRVHQPRGLIRYDSMRGLEGARRRVVRPRVVAYGAAAAALLVIGGLAFGGHEPFEAAVLRGGGAPYVLDGDVIRDTFTVHIVNKRDARTSFTIAPRPAPGVEFVVPLASVTIEPYADVRAPIIASIPRVSFHGARPLTVEVATGGHTRVLELRLLGPTP